jgi:hypothetical protein
MSDCKKMFNKDVFAYLINVMPDDIKNELTNCDEMSGGRKKKNRRKRMRGGDPNFRKRVVVGIYLFMGIVLSYVLGNMDKTTLIRGFEMLYSGQCNSMSELALDFLGLGNPICSTHHRMIVLIGCAMKGHMDAVMQILGAVATSIASPFLLHAAVERSAAIIEGQVSALMGQQGLTIEDINRPNMIQDEQNILTTLGDTPAITAAKTAEEIKVEIVRLGLLDQIRALLNLKQMTDEARIEEIHEEASRANSKESSQEYGGSRRKRSKSKRRKMTKKNIKHTRKHKKHSRKHRR